MSLDVTLYGYLHSGGAEPVRVPLHQQNVTHNLRPMWQLAGVEFALYESKGTRAGRWLHVLQAGVTKMRNEPAAFKALNPENGWGSYEGAMEWLQGWLEASTAHPDLFIEVCA